MRGKVIVFKVETDKTEIINEQFIDDEKKIKAIKRQFKGKNIFCLLVHMCLF